MWPGPYGEWGSRKYMLSSLDQSLKRMGLDYVDIFYHHRPDPDTPLEETHDGARPCGAQWSRVVCGHHNYPADKARQAAQILRQLGTPCLIHQPVYNMFNRWIEPDLLDVLGDEGIGCIPFSPLAQGLLTNRYLGGIEAGSRASKPWGFLKPEGVTDERIGKANKLNALAQARGQTLAQMALAWVLRDGRVTSALIGASKVQQIDDCVAATKTLGFSDGELKQIDAILG